MQKVSLFEDLSRKERRVMWLEKFSDNKVNQNNVLLLQHQVFIKVFEVH